MNKRRLAAVTFEIFAGPPIVIIPPYVTSKNAFRKIVLAGGPPKVKFEEAFAT